MKKRTLVKLVLLICLGLFLWLLKISEQLNDFNERWVAIFATALVLGILARMIVVALQAGKFINADWVLRKGQLFKVIGVIQLDTHSEKKADLVVEIDSEIVYVRFSYDGQLCPNRGIVYRYIGDCKFEKYTIGKSS